MSRSDDRMVATREARRGFLKGAAVAGGAVAVTVAARGAAAAAPEPVSAGADASGHGYRESAHVRAYYKTAAM